MTHEENSPINFPKPNNCLQTMCKYSFITHTHTHTPTEKIRDGANAKV